MSTKFTTESSSVGSGWNAILTKKRPNGEVYFEGHVVSPHGIVDVYSEIDFTSMTFVYGGKKYFRRWKKRFTPGGLSRFAKAFAKEIVTKKGA